MEDYYLKKLGTDKKFNTFLRYFKMPKYPRLFIFLTAAIMSEASILTSICMPSLLAIFIMWNCWIGAVEKARIIEKCVLEEMAWQTEFIEQGEEADCIKAFPGDPMYVTDEDRDIILLTHILSYWNMTMKQKIRWHYVELVQMTMVYAIVYLLAWCAY